MKSQNNETFLGTEKISSLLFKLSVPAMIAMMVTALYNLVDTIFIGQFVGPKGIGALSLAFPVQMLVMGVAGLFGFGAASVVSRSLGAGDKEKAALASGNTLFLSIVAGILTAVLGLVFMDDLLKLLGASENLMGYTREYLSVIMIGSVFITSAMASNNLIRAEGQAKMAMVTMLIGAVVNIALDPLFIIVFDMGIRGAAIATVISQFLSFAFIMWFFISGKSSLRITAKTLIPDGRLLKEIFTLGFPAFVRQGGMSLLMILVNNSLGHYGGDIYIAAYGVINRLFMFVLMPLFGITQGFQPIAGYNYGAGNSKRVKESVWVSMKVSTIIAVAAFCLLFFLPEFFMSLFSGDEQLISVGVGVLQVIILLIPLISFQIIGATYFQAIGKAFPSFILGMSRQFIFLIPLVLILPEFMGIQGVIVAFPIADLASTILTTVWLLIEMKALKHLKPIEVKKPEEALAVS